MEINIRGLWGVIGVSNEIAIKPKPNTSNIRDKIMVALDRSWFDPATINVTAQGGKVTLTGEVDFLVRAGRSGLGRLGRAGNDLRPERYLRQLKSFAARQPAKAG